MMPTMTTIAPSANELAVGAKYTIAVMGVSFACCLARAWISTVFRESEYTTFLSVAKLSGRKKYVETQIDKVIKLSCYSETTSIPRLVFT